MLLASDLSNLAQLVSKLNESFQHLLSWLKYVFGLVFLKIDSDGHAYRTGSALPEYDSTAVWPAKD